MDEYTIVGYAEDDPLPCGPSWAVDPANIVLEEEPENLEVDKKVVLLRVSGGEGSMNLGWESRGPGVARGCCVSEAPPC